MRKIEIKIIDNKYLRYLWPMATEWFTEWFDTPYYHLLYKNRDEAEAAEFINKLIAFLKPANGSRMLDVACGKGRHSIHLANKGFDVTGIDLSAFSINEALKSEQENLHFYTHDMRQPFWVNYFDYSFNFFTSFGYFKNNRDNQSAIQYISNSMKNGGILVLDYLNVPYAAANIDHQSKEWIESIEFTITRWYDDQKFYKKILIEDPTLPNPLSYTEAVSKITLEDFETLFASHHLKIKKLFGSYDLDSYQPETSPRLIMVAEKTM